MKIYIALAEFRVYDLTKKLKTHFVTKLFIFIYTIAIAYASIQLLLMYLRTECERLKHLMD